MALTCDFLTGFETGIINASGGGSAGGGMLDYVVSSASPTTSGRNGRGFQASPTATTSGMIGHVAITAARRGVMRFALKINSAPASGTLELASLYLTTGTNVKQATLQATYVDATHVQLQVLFLTGSAQVGPTIVAGASAVWTVIEMNVDVGGTTWTLDWKVDGVLRTQATLAGQAADTIKRFYIGTRVATGPAAAMRYDDWITGFSSSASPDEWWNDGNILAYIPNSDGAHVPGTVDFCKGDNTTTYITAATTDAYTQMAAVPWSATRSATVNICQKVANAAEYVELDYGASAVVHSGNANAVAAKLSYSSSGTAGNTMGCVARNSAGVETAIYGNAAAPADYSESTNFFKSAVVTPPGGGWTDTEVNAVRFRMGWSNDASPYPTVQGLMLEVDWAVAPAPSAVAVTAALATAGTLVASLLVPGLASAALGTAGTLTPILSAPVLASATLGGAGTLTANLTAAGIQPASASSALTGTGTVTAALAVKVPATATLGGVGTVTANPRIAVQPSATLAGVGTVVASLSVPAAAALSATLVGTGTIVPVLSVPSPLTSTLVGVGTVTASPRITVQIASSLVGAGTLTANPRIAVQSSATFAGVGAVTAGLSVTAIGVANAAATLAGAGSITANPRIAVQPSATLTGVGSATAGLSVPTIGAANISATLGGVGSVGFALSVIPRIAATLSSVGSLAASPRIVVQIGASLSGTGTITAAPRVTVQLSSVLAGTGTVSGNLDVPGAVFITATLVGTGTLTSTLRVPVLLSSVVSGSGSVVANLAVPSAALIQASFAGTGSTTGNLAVGSRMSSTLSAAGALTANLVVRTYVNVSATLGAVSSISPTLRVAVQMTSELSGVGAVVSDPRTAVQMSSTLDGFGTVTSTLDILSTSVLVAQLTGLGTISASPTAHKIGPHLISSTVPIRVSSAEPSRDGSSEPILDMSWR